MLFVFACVALVYVFVFRFCFCCLLIFVFRFGFISLIFAVVALGLLEASWGHLGASWGALVSCTLSPNFADLDSHRGPISASILNLVLDVFVDAFLGLRLVPKLPKRLRPKQKNEALA